MAVFGWRPAVATKHTRDAGGRGIAIRLFASVPIATLLGDGRWDKLLRRQTLKHTTDRHEDLNFRW